MLILVSLPLYFLFIADFFFSIGTCDTNKDESNSTSNPTGRPNSWMIHCLHDKLFYFILNHITLKLTTVRKQYSWNYSRFNIAIACFSTLQYELYMSITDILKIGLS